MLKKGFGLTVVQVKKYKSSFKATTMLHIADNINFKVANS